MTRTTLSRPLRSGRATTIPTVGSNFSNPSYSSVIKLTGSLTPNVLLEAAFNYDGNKIAIIPVAAGGANFVKPTGWSTGTYFAATNDVGNRLPDITWKTTASAQWGPGNDPWTNGAEDIAETFGLSVSRGKHTMKFGGGYNRYTKNQVIGKDSEGDYTFDDSKYRRCSHRRFVSGLPAWLVPPASARRTPIPSTIT